MGIKRNDDVEQILPAPIKGRVSGFSVDQETGDKLVHVVAADGSAFFFKENELKVVEAPPAEEEAEG